MTSIPGDLRERLGGEAAVWLEDWLEDPFHEGILPRLDFLMRHRPDELVDSFRKRCAVGTGGMRAAVGLGPNRFNHETLGRAVQGHAELLRRHHPDRFVPGAEPPTVVVAYDVRRFHDRKGVFDGFQEHDVLTGVSSVDFAAFAAIGYAVNGIRALVPAEEAPRVSTPELSFAIRRGGYIGGINISASHNHPDDNGVKFYDASGAQVSGAVSDELEEAIWSVDLPDPLSADEAEQAMLRIQEYGTSLHEDYLAETCRGFDARSGESIVFTPLEGVGADSVAPALQRVCPGLHIEGGAGDGAFATVPFGLPNPEIDAVFGPAQARAEAEGATLVLASDPDADRLGLAAREPGGAWRHFTGNQIGALLLEWLCRRHAGDLGGRVLIQTCVTGRETVAIARHHGLDLVDDLPVGFKFIARAIDAIAARGQRLLFAFEESLGYLRSEALREKDAAGAAVVLASAHLELASAGLSLIDLYEEINVRHGHHASTTRSVVMAGVDGLATQDRIIELMRAAAGIPGTQLSLTRDFGQRPCALLDLSAPGDRESLNVLELEGRVEGVPTRLCIRKSGTEPKIKFYFEIHGDPDARLDDITCACLRALLAPVEISYSRIAHALPDHIPIREKLRFEREIAPGVLAPLASGGDPALTPGLEAFLRYFRGASRAPLFEALWRSGDPDLDLGALDDFVTSLG